MWYDSIPISVNDTYGDPFIPEQIIDTVLKFKSLQKHKAPIALFTKAPYDKKIIERLKATNIPEMLTPMYSLTDLEEGGFSFENRVRMIREVEEAIDKPVTVLVRPIIRGQNDDPKTLKKIIDVAANGSKTLVLGGIHDKYKMKKLKSNIEEQMLEMCDKVGVAAFYKSSCCASYIHDTECWMHDMKPSPINVDVAKSLGYNFEVRENKIYLPKATTGDLNFLRMLCRTEIYTSEISSNYNLMSVSTKEHKLECTSSWYAWCRNIDTCVGCKYCIIEQIEYLQREILEVGVHPRELLGIRSQQIAAIDFDSYKFNKLKEDVEATTYNCVRIPKLCLVETNRKKFKQGIKIA